MYRCDSYLQTIQPRGRPKEGSATGNSGTVILVMRESGKPREKEGTREREIGRRGRQDRKEVKPARRDKERCTITT